MNYIVSVTHSHMSQENSGLRVFQFSWRHGKGNIGRPISQWRSIMSQKNWVFKLQFIFALLSGCRVELVVNLLVFLLLPFFHPLTLISFIFPAPLSCLEVNNTPSTDADYSLKLRDLPPLRPLVCFSEVRYLDSPNKHSWTAPTYHIQPVTSSP